MVTKQERTKRLARDCALVGANVIREYSRKYEEVVRFLMCPDQAALDTLVRDVFDIAHCVHAQVNIGRATGDEEMYIRALGTVIAAHREGYIYSVDVAAGRIARCVGRLGEGQRQKVDELKIKMLTEWE